MAVDLNAARRRVRLHRLGPSRCGRPRSRYGWGGQLVQGDYDMILCLRNEAPARPLFLLAESLGNAERGGALEATEPTLYNSTRSSNIIVSDQQKSAYYSTCLGSALSCMFVIAVRLPRGSLLIDIDIHGIIFGLWRPRQVRTRNWFTKRAAKTLNNKSPFLIISHCRMSSGWPDWRPKRTRPLGSASHSFLHLLRPRTS